MAPSRKKTMFRLFHSSLANNKMSVHPGQTKFITTLPDELQLMIIGFLDEADQYMLRQTCQHFKSAIPAIEQGEIFTAERRWCQFQWHRSLRKEPSHPNLFGCQICLRLRKKHCFADKDTQRLCKRFRDFDRGKTLTTVCLDCSIKSKVFAPGDHVQVQGKDHVFCTSCGQLGLCTGGEKQQKCMKCIVAQLGQGV